MSDITSEQERLLKTLIRHEKAGEPAGEYINRIRRPRLNAENVAAATGEPYDTSHGYQVIEPMLQRLLKEGLVEPWHYDGSWDARFPYGRLTSEGRCYFKDRERRTSDQRRHDYKVAAFGAVVGGVLGLFSGALGGAFLSGSAKSLAEVLASVFAT